MKREISMAVRDWQIVLDAIGGSGGRDTQEQAERFKLWLALSNKIQHAEGGALTIALTSAQRKAVISIMERPPVPWRIEKTEYVWQIMERFGWTRPALEDVDDSEDDDGANG